MKKISALLAVCLLAAGLLSACGGTARRPAQPPEEEENPPQEEVQLRLWTYPVGGWGESAKLASLISGFHETYPNIRISIECLDYQTGDGKIEQALSDGQPPDLVLEGPERLVANWGDRGLMADLSGLWESETAGKVYDSVRAACRHRSGAYYEVPLCMNTHCMAVNYDLFEAAGALQYIDQERRTWSTEDFTRAIAALRAYGQENAAAVYCGGQGGDQGTRALVTNLYGGSFTNREHTGYTIDCPENIRALQLLYDMEGISFEPELTGQEEIAMFCRGELAMSFCWNGSIEVNQTVTNPDLNFDILPVAFPTDSGEPRLESGIWGFGVFDSGDAARIQAAKTFIRYMTEDDSQYTKAVLASMQRPVRDMENIYANDALMQEYSVFTRYMGDYCQITPGWVEARTAWWQMLQQIGQGADIPGAVHEAAQRVGEP